VYQAAAERNACCWELEQKQQQQQPGKALAAAAAAVVALKEHEKKVPRAEPDTEANVYTQILSSTSQSAEFMAAELGSMQQQQQLLFSHKLHLLSLLALSLLP
jgi:hypothetical protein